MATGQAAASRGTTRHAAPENAASFCLPRGLCHSVRGAANGPAAQTKPTNASSLPDPTGSASAAFAFEALALPGATAPVSLDYLAFEPGRARVWVPVGTTGSVDVFNIKTAAFDRIDGFGTVQREFKGRTRTMGPSAVAIGEGAAYIGNRATSEICSVDTESLKLATCVDQHSRRRRTGLLTSARRRKFGLLCRAIGRSWCSASPSLLLRK